MLKIAYIFDQVLPCAAADVEQVMNTVSALSKQDNVEITLFLPADNHQLNTSAEELKAFYHVDGTFRVELFHSAFPGPRIIEKLAHPAVCAIHRKLLKQFDVVYCRNIPVVSMCLALRIPVVMDTYRPWPKQYRALGLLFKAFFANKYFLGMTYHSNYARIQYIKLGIDADKTCTAHNGYNPAQFEPELSKQEAREQLGLPVDHKTVVYSGRVDMHKGLDQILVLAKARPDVEFLFVGSQGKGEFESLAEALPNCHVYPWQKYGGIAKYLYAADIVMIPPSSGPLNKVGNTVLPIKLYSYFASHRAIYAPIAPDTKELLEHNRNAYLVKPDDPQDALNGFNQLIDDDERIERLSAEVTRDAASLTWENRAKTVLEFIQSRLKVYRGQ